MASYKYELAPPPTDPDAWQLWLTHAAGHVFFEDVRGYAMKQIDPNLPPEVRASVEKGIDDAVYGLMMLVDGVSGLFRNSIHEVELGFEVKLIERESAKVLETVDLRHCDGMCMGYHYWRENDYGTEPVAIRRPRK